jgi:hypothetical protein
MPLFFFDVLQDGKLSVDTEGSELPDLDAAREEAVNTIAEMSADAIPRTRGRQLSMIVRDGRGNSLLQLDLGFTITELHLDRARLTVRWGS